jgi:hypothetical protein
MSDRRLTIVFGEDQSLTFLIPVQRELPSERVSLMNRISTSDHLTMEVEGELYVIPWASIRYLRIDPVLPDDMLPSTVLKGLRLAG